jgi:hypothetical protein
MSKISVKWMMWKSLILGYVMKFVGSDSLAGWMSFSVSLRWVLFLTQGFVSSLLRDFFIVNVA